MPGQQDFSPTLVRDLMTVGVPTCSIHTPITDLARVILERGFETIVVLDDGNAVGVVSHVELIRAYAREVPLPLKASDIMREGVPQIPPDIPLKAAAQIMLDQGVRSIFMMHHAGGVEYPAAVITFTHFLRHLAARDEQELSDLGIKAQRRLPLEDFIEKRNAARRRHRVPDEEDQI